MEGVFKDTPHFLHNLLVPIFYINKQSNTKHNMSILGNITTEEFLRDYWQKKPLVIRGAFADFEMPFDAGELAGLALETDCPARIILEKGTAPENTTLDKNKWTVQYPPFTDESFTSTPETHWTFLVNDLERYYPELGNFIEPFRFIPDWRIDDLMVSYAADQGSVGPHVDAYDVFLIQGEGKRRWQVVTDPDYPTELLQDSQLAILKNFKHDEEWLLDTGDMLYLPPNMPHHGKAEGECMTFSVGFRAPDTIGLTQSWLESFNADGTGDSEQEKATKAIITKRFYDAERKIQKSSGEIVAEDIQKLSSLIMDLVKNQEQQLPIFLGKYLTETKNGEEENEQNSLQPQSSKFSKKADYERQSWTRISYIEDKQNKSIHLFAAGLHVTLPQSERAAIQAFCEHYFYSAESLKPLFEYDEFKAMFKDLLKDGSLFGLKTP